MHTNAAGLYPAAFTFIAADTVMHPLETHVPIIL